MAVTTDNTSVVVTAGAGEGTDVRTYHAWHRNFPEAVGEGESESEALDRLRTQFEHAMEHVQPGDGLEAMRVALSDVLQQQSIR